MIGTRENALLAYTRPLEFKIGEGWSREAYAIDGVIYKVEIDEPGVNLQEFDNAARIAADPIEGILVPAMSTYDVGFSDVILACEMITGTLTGECSAYWMGTCDDAGNCVSDALLYPVRQRYGIGDLGYGNLMRNDAGIWLIDLGESPSV